jgi:hypothetical protein
MAVEYFFSVLNPTVITSLTPVAGAEIVVNITEQQRHTGAYGYHVKAPFQCVSNGKMA